MNTTTINNTGVDIALKIIEEGKKPMSIDEIKAKYQLSFPFRVVKVAHARRGNLPIGSYLEVYSFVRDEVQRCTPWPDRKATPQDYLASDRSWVACDEKQWNLASDV